MRVSIEAVNDPKTRNFKTTEIVRDVIIGMSDGLTVPFALAAGLSGAVSNSSIIVVAGLAEIVAGSISMGLGGYLAAENDSDYYYSELAREKREVAETPELEREEVVASFKKYGLERHEVEPILSNFEKNPDVWVDFMMRHELNLEEPHPKRAVRSAGTIALSYIVGGLVPLAPYFFISTPHKGLLASAILTLISLTIFGYAKSRFVGVNPWKGALRTAVIGSVAAAAAYGIASLLP
jgi:VIT1/CCC1 family predicted Fe2+/Mn2+ transporter